ncbi:MAG: ABC transporter substrate-binding protein [Planctomycetota bacterium]|nr:ABC transporter substrate-binding protein [Planctomycetota bacterium]
MNTTSQNKGVATLRSRRTRWSTALRVALVAVIAMAGASNMAQEEAPAVPAIAYVDEKTPLLERDPFDLIVLDKENKDFKAEVQTITTLPRPRAVVVSEQKGKLQFRFLYDDALLYEVEWIHLVKVEFFERMLFQEAKRLVEKASTLDPQTQFVEVEGLLDEAYRYYTRMKAEFPTYPGLEAAIDYFLFQDAGTLYKGGRYAESLSVMEQLYQRNPTYNSGRLKDAMGKLVTEIVADYVSRQDFRSARIVLDRLEEKYGNDQPTTIKQWRDQLNLLAGEKLTAAKKHLEVKEYRESIGAIRQALDISPNVPGGKALEAELAKTYPQIIVGVTQPALTYDSGRLDNWAARRTGHLVHRTLIEFLGPGSEGGEYEFPGGLIERSPDGRTMTFRMKQFTAGDNSPITSGYDLSRRLLDLANPKSPEYREAWGGLVTGVTVENVLKVDVTLRRSHVRPQALLRVPMVVSIQQDGKEALEGTGSFRVDIQGDSETRFMLKDFTPGSRLAELIERKFDDAQSALNALRRGQIDVIDRLFPSDAARLKDQLGRDSDLVLQQYKLPTVHLLVPKSDHPFLANANFRRALVWGIDRQRILREELLGGNDIPGCRVISGPFPAGIDQTDPLGYAYDHTLLPRVWRPRLAKVLTFIAENELTTKAEKLGEEPPKLTPLLIAHPATESARIACQAIMMHLSIIGIEVKVKELLPGQSTDPADECDLLYTEIAIWEPVVDARKLLGVNGIAAATSPYIGQALRRLDATENWGDVHDQLVALHHAAYNEVPVIPLWQTVDSFVYNKRVRNIGDQPVWLYQNVDQWRIGEQAAQP